MSIAVFSGTTARLRKLRVHNIRSEAQASRTGPPIVVLRGRLPHRRIAETLLAVVFSCVFDHSSTASDPSLSPRGSITVRAMFHGSCAGRNSPLLLLYPSVLAGLPIVFVVWVFLDTTKRLRLLIPPRRLVCSRRTGEMKAIYTYGRVFSWATRMSPFVPVRVVHQKMGSEKIYTVS